MTLEEENGRLKRMPADAVLDNAALKDLLEKVVKPTANERLRRTRSRPTR